MKPLLKLTFLACITTTLISCSTQKNKGKIENVVFITIDGFRWQEAFNGMDSAIANNPKYNQSSKDYIFKKYWTDDFQARREKLMPFLWTTIAKHGQIYGNRNYNNNVDVSNPYWFSSPGYSELFCGYVDTAINSNNYINNPNQTFFEFLNSQKEYKGKVALFGAWAALPYIVNDSRCDLVISSAYQPKNKLATEKEQLINEMLMDSYSPWGESECMDSYVFFQGFEYLKTHKPKVLYMMFGETDEWAHDEKYKNYLEIVHTTDKWIERIWNYIQSHDEYKNKTLLFITIDHGRGEGNRWTDHNSSVPNSHQTWFAVMGPGLKPLGEVREPMQIYNKQFAKTICSLLGFDFISKEKDLKGINIPLSHE